MDDSWFGGGEGVGLLSLTVAHDGIVKIGLFGFLLEAMTYCQLGQLIVYLKISD